MKLNIFTKTFLMLLVSFSMVFLLSVYISYNRFSPMYIEENIEAVKEAIVLAAPAIRDGTELDRTALADLSSETSFIRYQLLGDTERIGPNYLGEEDILDFVIAIYDNDEAIVEDNLTYYVEQVDDIYRINYIYEFEFGDYLIITTRIQSLTNVDRVLTILNLYQSIAMLIVITLLSLIISLNMTQPLKKINKYAKDISNLKFDGDLRLNRKDEFRELVTSLNEMTFNLQKTYAELNDANLQLVDQIDYKQRQEEKKQHFIMTINHELKTPLAVMRGMVEGMLDKVGRYNDRDKYLHEVLDQIHAIETITRDLTYTLRLEDKINPDDTTSTTDIKDALATLEELRVKRGVKLHTELPQATLTINPELLAIAVVNLVKNAMIYTTDGTVRIQGDAIDGHYAITVRNKGEIAPERIRTIFDSFTRADTLGVNREGSGLGLFIVKQICNLYGYDYKLFNDNGEVVAKLIVPIKSS